MTEDVPRRMSCLVPVVLVRAQRRMGMPSLPQRRAGSYGLLSLMILLLAACGS